MLHTVTELKHRMFLEKYERIFISHREIDQKEVHAFINLLYTIGVPRPIYNEKSTVFCTSHPAAYIQNGSPIFDEIKQQFNSHEHTYYILWYTKNYFQSQACINEAGAVWAMSKHYQEILSPGLDRGESKGLLGRNNVSFYSNDRFRLNNLKQQIERMFDLQPINPNYWETERDKFIDLINSIHVNN